MIKVRKATERGHANHGWLDSHHTFSFANYYDPEHMGFGPLRVINEDRVEPGQGFGTHPHRDMEIMTYVLEGALEHKDSMGTGSIIRPGEVQLMSAGTGVTHSEYNHSNQEGVHFLQIWVMPDKIGGEPSYQQRQLRNKEDQLELIASPNSSEESLLIRQDANIYRGVLKEGQRLVHQLSNNRLGWLQLARGELVLRGSDESEVVLQTSDGVAIAKESRLNIRATKTAEFLFFDLPE